MKVKVKFIGDAFYNKEIAHRKGDIEELKSDMALRWIKRGVAEYFVESEKEVPQEEAAELTKEDEAVENEEEQEEAAPKKRRKKA